MKKNIKKVLIFLVVMFVLISCTSCDSKNIGYYPKISRADLKKVESITISVNGIQYNYDKTNDDFPEIRDRIETMLRSGKFHITQLTSGKVKMPCDDSTVNSRKINSVFWFEMFMNGGNYEKVFFAMSSDDTQTIWIYSTSTDSYSDGKFLRHYSCDCKDLLALLNSYNVE